MPQDNLKLVAPVLVSVSYAHPAVPADSRAPLSIAENDLAEALSRLPMDSRPDEVVIISTCLRHEIIAVGADEATLEGIVR